MIANDKRQFAEAQIASRLRDVLGHVDVGNYTRVADALASALKLDRRMSGRNDGLAVHAALADDDIFDLAADLIESVQSGKYSFSLPIGTEVTSNTPGDLRIGGEHWILDASRSGLHPMEPMRRDAHGPNFDLLLTQIDRLTRRLACRRLGLPSAVFIVDNDDRHLLHFPPCAEAGGVVLQRWANGTTAPRFAAALPEQVIDFAKSIVSDMRALWKRKKEIAARVETVRKVVSAAAAANGATVDLIAIDMERQHDDRELDLYVHFNAIDEAFRDGPVLDFVPEGRGRGLENYSAPWSLEHRPAERSKLKALGADGWIDDMAAAVLSKSSALSATVLAALATEYETTIEIPGTEAPTFVTFYWRDGVIKAEISANKKLDWARDQLVLMNVKLPETVLTAWPGRSVEAVAQLPFPCPIIVERLEQLERGVRLTLKTGERMINLKSGAIFGSPRSDW